MGTEERLRELQEREARLRQLEQSDEVGLKLEALRKDIHAAQTELDATIAQSRERAKRLDGGA